MNETEKECYRLRVEIEKAKTKSFFHFTIAISEYFSYFYKNLIDKK